MKVLVVEDDVLIREGLAEILTDEGYQVLSAEDGKQGLELYRQERPDFLCLDVMMPGMSGYDLCRTIRTVDDDRDTPIIFISAKAEEVDRVLGLELGADDFIMKPFGVSEVLARVRAVSRRALARQSLNDSSASFTMGDLCINPAEQRARRGTTVIDLGARDIKILRLLYQRRGQVVSRLTLFQVAWGLEHMPKSRTLDQHISQLRKRVEMNAQQPRLIQTVHGVGYRFDE